ncbi:MAG: hypothetical protein ACXWQA_16560, partial [Pseudobdellovibrionaceae bacterium]
MPFLNSVLKNERGQGLISILTAIPVTVVAVLLIGTVIYAIQKESTQIKSKGEANIVEQNLRLILDSRNDCASRLDASTTTYNLTAASSATGMDLAYLLNDMTSVARSNQSLPKYGIYINTLKFKVYASGGTNFSADPRIPGNQLQYG